jgi:hypothetical protein
MLVFGRLLLADERDRARVACVMDCLASYYPQKPLYDQDLMQVGSATPTNADSEADPMAEARGVVDLEDDAPIDGVTYTVQSITDLHYTLRIARCTGAFPFAIVQELRRTLKMSLVDVVLQCETGRDAVLAEGEPLPYHVDVLLLKDVARVAAESSHVERTDAAYNPHFSARVHRELARLQTWNPRDDEGAPRRDRSATQPAQQTVVGRLLARCGIARTTPAAGPAGDADNEAASTSAAPPPVLPAHADVESRRALFEPLSERDARRVASGDLCVSTFEAVRRYFASQSYPHDHPYGAQCTRRDQSGAVSSVALNTIAPDMRLLAELMHSPETHSSEARADEPETAEPMVQRALISGYSTVRVSTLTAMMRSPLFNKRVVVARIVPRVLAVTRRFPRIFMSLLDRVEHTGVLSVELELRAPSYVNFVSRKSGSPQGALTWNKPPHASPPHRMPAPILGKRRADEMLGDQAPVHHVASKRMFV